MRNKLLSRAVICLSLLVTAASAEDILVSTHSESEKAASSDSVPSRKIPEAMPDALAALAQKWPRVWYPKGKEPETEEQRQARLGMSGKSVAKEVAETDTKFLPIDAAALVLTLWFHESNGEYFVHAGGVSPLGTQDHGRARCMGQVQTWPKNTLLTPQQHASLAGLDQAATERCAEATLKYFWQHAQQCMPSRNWSVPLTSVEAALLYAAYGAGKCAPVSEKSRIRANTWAKARIAIRASLAEAASK